MIKNTASLSVSNRYRLLQKISIICVLCFISACASVGSRFSQAKSEDTTQAYDAFLKEYPDSEYTKEANERLRSARSKEEALKAQREKEIKQREDNLIASNKKKAALLVSYKPGKLSRKLFRKAWGLTLSNKLGIVSVSATTDEITYQMGIHPGVYKEDADQFSMGMPVDMNKYILDAPEKSWLKRDADVVTTEINNTHVLCELTFNRKDVLVKTTCVKKAPN